MKPPPVSDLLIDISNTFTKAAITRRGKVLEPHIYPTSDLSLKVWRKLLEEGGPFRRVVVASVVPKADAALKKVYPDANFLHGKLHLPVPLAYPKPGEIGADRLANAIALYSLEKYPAIAVDFGTAITLDILDAEGAYAGGIIAPGWQMMTSYLHDKTALLPLTTLQKKPAAIGQSTEQAIRSGIYHGFIGLVQNIVLQASNQLPVPPKLIVATGGDSDWIAREIPQIQRTLPGLTLDGLFLYSEFLNER